MHFCSEIVNSDELHVPAGTKVGKKETEMAQQLVKSMSGKWEPEKYKDDYKEALMEVIEEKVAAGGKEVTKHKKTKGVKATNVIDLVSVLQKSLQEHGSSRSKKASRQKTRRKAA
jgi:DNA end-binding protein Ku